MLIHAPSGNGERTHCIWWLSQFTAIQEWIYDSLILLFLLFHYKWVYIASTVLCLEEKENTVKGQEITRKTHPIQTALKRIYTMYFRNLSSRTSLLYSVHFTCYAVVSKSHSNQVWMCNSDSSSSIFLTAELTFWRSTTIRNNSKYIGISYFLYLAWVHSSPLRDESFKLHFSISLLW